MLYLPVQQAQIRSSPIGTNTPVTHTQAQRCSTPGAPVQCFFFLLISIIILIQTIVIVPSRHKQTRSQSRRANPKGLEGQEHQSEADKPRAQALFPITGRRSQGESFLMFVVCRQNSVAFAVWYSKQEFSGRAASGQAAAWDTRGVRGL